MQYGTPGFRPTAPIDQQLAAGTDESGVIAGLESIVLTSSPNSSEVPAAPATTRAEPGPAKTTSQTHCHLSARATSAPNATARLRVSAPCHSGQTVAIHHNGLSFTDETDKNGQLDVTIPALSEFAIFLVSFEDQKGTVATTHVTDILAFDRVALQWRGTSAMQIHALEFGASYGQDGHVWSDTTTSGIGNVVRLGSGSTPQSENVEIYSFPARTVEKSGFVELSVETEVTDANCGQDLQVQSLELRSQILRSRETILSIPDCSASGDFLVLNNLFQDLTIAAR